jgi:cytoskeletal protein CcmA (bactofilin family)
MKFGRRETLFANTDDVHPNGHAMEDTVSPAILPAAVPATRARPANQLNAFLGDGCIYEGKLTFEGRVRIDGKFTGEIFSNDTLEVGPDAEIEAEIDVSTVIVAGKVTGNINARGRCDLRAPGMVVGNITSPIVTMEEGVRFDGEMCMSKALDSVVRAGTLRAAAATEPEPAENTLGRPRGSGRRSAPAAPDPSDLLKPVP